MKNKLAAIIMIFLYTLNESNAKEITNSYDWPHACSYSQISFFTDKKKFMVLNSTGEDYSAGIIDTSSVQINHKNKLVGATVIYLVRKAWIVNQVNALRIKIQNIGVHQGVVDATRKLMADTAKKYGVTQREMGTAEILKAQGLDGSLTPAQEREVTKLEGEIKWMENQGYYLSDVVVDYQNNRIQYGPTRGFDCSNNNIWNGSNQAEWVDSTNDEIANTLVKKYKLK